MEVVRLHTGPAFDIYGLIIDRVCLIEEYIDSLKEEEQKKVFALFNRILEHGPPQNELRFRHIGDQIYELKTHTGTRILSFYGGSYLSNSLILAHGFDKPKKKILARQRKKVMKWRETAVEIIERPVSKESPREAKS